MKSISWQKIVSLTLGLVLAIAYLCYGITAEAPTGSVSGTLVMADTGKPLPHAFITISDNSAQVGQNPLPDRSAVSDSQGHFLIKDVIAGRYDMSISAKAHSISDRKLTVVEGARNNFDLSLKADKPFINLSADQHVYQPGVAPRIEIDGFTPQKDLTVKVTRLDPTKVAAAGGLQATFEPLTNQERIAGPEKLGTSALAYQETPNRDAEGVYIGRLKIPGLSEGLYWVECSSGGVRTGTYLNVTTMAMVVKFVGRQVLAYTTNIQSGEPIPNADIEVGSGHGLRKAAQTDSRGLANLNLLFSEKSSIVALKGQSMAFCSREGADFSTNGGKDIVFLYTDRPVYRPGDTVHFKGIVRTPHGTGFTLPTSGKVEVDFEDESQNVIQRKEMNLSQHGSFDGSFSISAEMAPQGAQIMATAPHGHGSRTVVVADYRKPDYKVTIKPTKPLFYYGDKASAEIDCQYYYGAPVVGAKVKVSIYRTQGLSDSSDESDSGAYSDDSPSWMDEGFQGGDYQQTLEATTDANGKVVVTFPTRADDDPDTLASDYEYSIEADVSDVGDKTFTGDGTVKVVQGDYALDVSSIDEVIDPGQIAQVEATVTSQSTGEPVANRTVQLTAGTEKWDGNDAQFQQFATLSAVTDANGVAHFPVTAPKGGSISLRGLVVDDSRRQIRSNGYIYVSGNDPIGNDDQPSLTILVDRKDYGIGDTARVLIQTSKPGGEALLTTEADSIMSERLVRLSQKSTMVEIPLTKEMAPNVYVSVVYVKDQQLMNSNHPINVTREDQKLRISVVPDKQTTTPGGKVKYTVKVADSSGKPCAATASLSVVDEAIYQIRSDRTNIEADFYPYRYDNVSMAYSFETIYLDGGAKGTGQMKVRSRFEDTAAWVPNLEIDSNGVASQLVSLPDNLTTWRGTVVACTDDGKVGLAKVDVLAKKDLMATLQPPSSMVVSDAQQVALTVTNGTDAPIKANVAVTSVGLAVTGAPDSPVEVAANSATTIPLQVVALKTGQCSLQAMVRANNGLGDALRMKFPVSPRAMESLATVSGSTQSSAELQFTRDAKSGGAVGGVTLHLSPSVAQSLLAPLAGMVDFPYGCVEQTMSRLCPSVTVTDTFKKLGLPAPYNADRVNQIVTDSYTRLGRLQHADGGWGWWEYDASDEFMTAYVLDGLERVARLGAPKPMQINLDKALKYARIIAMKPIGKGKERDRAYLLYALAVHGNAKFAKKYVAELAPAHLSAEALAIDAMARAACGLSADKEIALLEKEAVKARDGIRWTSSKDEEWGDEPTGFALQALSDLKPNSPLIPQAVSYLVHARNLDGWMSTRQSNFIVDAICTYLDSTRSELSPSTVDISVDGKSVSHTSLNPKSISIQNSTVFIPIKDLPIGRFSVKIVRSGGPGSVFYSGELKQYPVDVAMDGSGTPQLRVSRQWSLLTPVKTRNGNLRLEPKVIGPSSVQTGSILQCELKIYSDRKRSFMQIECPVPSNCQITERDDPLSGDSWSWWWASTVIRQSSISFFATDLHKGENTITFTVRAESPGICTALPAVVGNMYDFSQKAWTRADAIKVTP